MNMYSEFYNDNRKATISKSSSLGFNPVFEKWEVTLSVDGRVVEKRVALSEDLAKIMAEDFVNMGTENKPTLLNE